MATYVLVHGGDRTGDVWQSVSQLLIHNGHQVFCPTMTSVKQATLQQNITEICELIQNNHLQNIILVGHSYAAMVITGVLDQLHNYISCMIYIDSVIPCNGKSLYGLLAENGFNYQNFELTPDAACLEPLTFDKHYLQEKPKAYIHCLQSEFFVATQPFYKYIIEHAEKDHWLYFDLNTIHSCMLTQPRELAAILSGMQLFVQS